VVVIHTKADKYLYEIFVNVWGFFFVSVSLYTVCSILTFIRKTSKTRL